MTLKPLKGQHHVSAITANAKENYRFYTKIMGERANSVPEIGRVKN